MERVTTIYGNKSMIFIAPHIEDDYTGAMAKQIANNVSGYAVINNGWKKSKHYDYDNELCDCNNLKLLTHEDVPREEFFEPLLQMMQMGDNGWDMSHVNSCNFLLHGMTDAINEKRSVRDTIDMILGCGGKARNTMPDDMAVMLSEFLIEEGFNVAIADDKSKFAGRSIHNLNQLVNNFFGHGYSVQIEIVKAMRFDLATATQTAALMANAFHNFFQADVTKYRPKHKVEIVS